MPDKTFMKIVGRTFVISSILLVAFSAFGYFLWYNPKFNSKAENQFTISEPANKAGGESIIRLRQKALLVKDYVSKHDYNREQCFLLDMKISSGENRFFVYNLRQDSLEIAGLVTHGSGSDNSTEDLIFSNIKNSNCTSLGKYKIGNAYFGKFGLAYKLYGLDKSNNNAYERFVVLHAHDCVPNSEVSPLPICVSLGCPTVAPAFLAKLKTYLEKSQKPVLLWIYY